MQVRSIIVNHLTCRTVGSRGPEFQPTIIELGKCTPPFPFRCTRVSWPIRRRGDQKMIRTKIIATMGPACGTVELLSDLFTAGVDVCRLNFSHGSLDAHLLTLRNIRQAAMQHDKP